MIRNTIIVFLSLLLVASVYFQYRGNAIKSSVLVRSDTVTVYKHDTITIYKPVTKYQYITQIRIDTLYSTDSVQVPVQVPIEKKTYEDSTYKAVVSGYMAALDTIQVYPVHTNTTITNTIYKRKRFNVGVQAGVGWGLYNKKPDLFIGLGFTYRLF